MKKIPKFALGLMVSYMDKLMNYEQKSSNSNNYESYQTSSSPTSFPDLMENGIIVNYENIVFSSEIVEETTTKEEE